MARAAQAMKRPHTENTVGQWAHQKLDGLEHYLNAYTTALKYQPFSLVYVDAFAGAGRFRVRSAGPVLSNEDDNLFDDDYVISKDQFIEGSPRRALGLCNPFDKYFFFDADESRAELLKGLRIDYPDRTIEVQRGDANEIIQGLIPSIVEPMTRGVAFLDPYGPHLDWKTVEALGRTKKFEVIINFPLGMAINRLITRSGDIPENWRNGLKSFFGGDDWEDLVYARSPDLFESTKIQKVDDAAQRLLEFYMERLSALFPYVATPSVVRNTRKFPIYYMLWAGPNQRGFGIAESVLSKGERIGPLKKRSKR